MPKPWLRIGRGLWVLLAGNTFIEAILTVWVMVQLFQAPSARMVQGLQAQGLALDFYGGYLIVAFAITVLVFFIVALLIFLRRPSDGYALLVATFLLNFGMANGSPQFTEFLQFYQNPPLWYAVPSFLTTLFSYPLFIAFFVLYPDGRFVPRWSRYAAGYMLVLGILWTCFPVAFTSPTSPIALLGSLSVVLAIATGLVAQIWRYRRYASTLQKQQMKWLLLALAIALVVTIPEIFVPLLQFNPLDTPAASILGDLVTATASLSYICIPIAVGVAILRYRLWDIDVLVRRTATYGLLAALLAAIYFGSVIVLQQLFATVSGQRSEVITVFSTLVIAALFVPLRNRIQSVIDKRFNRKKYDAQEVLQEFAVAVRDETDLETLTGSLLGVVNETMQPRSASVWLNTMADGGRRTEG